MMKFTDHGSQLELIPGHPQASFEQTPCMAAMEAQDDCNTAACKRASEPI